VDGRVDHEGPDVVHDDRLDLARVAQPAGVREERRLQTGLDERELGPIL
jgi:hypothetical protein